MPQAGRRRPVPLAERINRARRSGLAVVVTVRPACPSCGDQRLRTHGTHAEVRYLRCRGCGQQIRGVVASTSEVDVQPTETATPSPAPVVGPDDPVDDETRTMAAQALAGWRVRLAAVRVEKCIRLGMEPRRDDVAMLGQVAGPDLGGVHPQAALAGRRAAATGQLADLETWAGRSTGEVASG